MSSTSRLPFDRLDAAIDDAAMVDPIFLTTTEKQHALAGWSRVIARAQAQQLRVLAAADDIAEQTGDRSTAHWLATTTREHPGTARGHAALADALDRRWTLTADALAAGDLNLAQVRVITEALDALPEDLGDDLTTKAEALIVAEAAQLGPRELRVYGGRLLEYLAPDVAEEAEYRRLLVEERRAEAATRLSLRRRGDGSTDIHGRVADHVAGRLGAYLEAFLAPRRRHLDSLATQTVDTPFGPLTTTATDEAAQLPLDRQRGIAFVSLLERILGKDLPRHGGTATTVAVTIDHDTLVADLDAAGLATTSTGHRITAGQARRLACQASIIPFVMSGRSVILDQGRAKRLFTDSLRQALNLLHPTCTTPGCTVPATWTEAHHKTPWSRGGQTRLQDGTLLCPFHHHRAHDPGWETRHHPNGSTTFHRRT